MVVARGAAADGTDAGVGAADGDVGAGMEDGPTLGDAVPGTVGVDANVGEAVPVAVSVGVDEDGPDEAGPLVGAVGTTGSDGETGVAAPPDPVTASPTDVPVDVESEIG